MTLNTPSGGALGPTVPGSSGITLPGETSWGSLSACLSFFAGGSGAAGSRMGLGGV